LKDYKETYNEYKESLEHRIDQETDHNLRVMEGKFERQKNEFYSALGELKKNISDTLQQFDDGLHKLYTQNKNFEDFKEDNTRENVLANINKLI